MEYERIAWLITVQNHNGGPCKIIVIVDRAFVVRHIVKCRTILYHVIPHTASQYHTLLIYTGLANTNHPTWNLLGLTLLRALVRNFMYVDFRPTSGINVITNIDDPT